MNFSRLPLWVKLAGSYVKRVGYVITQGVDNVQVYEGFRFGDMFNQSFDSIVKKDDDVLRKRFKKDAASCYVRWGFTPRDYFLFGFHSQNMTVAKRKTFISDYYKDYALFSKEGPEKYAELFDKTRFLNRIDPASLGNMGGYFLFDKDVKEKEFVGFALRYPDLFIKPNSSSYGNGAMTALIKSEDEAKALFAKLKETGADWVVEKRIVQSEAMAKWNVSSVNTVRINTFLTNRGFFVLGPFIRTGRKGAIVDNGGKGGVYALVDEKTGRILTDGRDENGGSYPKHPDSGIPFKNEMLPDWKGLLKTVETAHCSNMPDHIYISWDLAYTNNGWVIIEGNWGQFICQQSSSYRGFKKGFIKYLKGKAITQEI